MCLWKLKKFSWFSVQWNFLKRSFQNKECSPKRTCAYWLWIVCAPATIKKKNKKNRIYFKICQTKNITNMGDAGYQTWHLCSGSLRLKLSAKVFAVNLIRYYGTCILFQMNKVCLLHLKKSIEFYSEKRALQGI